MADHAYKTTTHDQLVVEGKLLRFPERTYTDTTVITIDLDWLAARLKYSLRLVLPINYALRKLYPRITMQEVEDEIGRGIDHMIDVAMHLLYNRLRVVADRYSPDTRTTRMHPRAPQYQGYEFPTFLSSLISSIGPLRIKDGLEDTLIIYATDAAHAHHYGRSRAVNPNLAVVETFLETCKRAKMPVVKIDLRSTIQGSFFSTITPIFNNNEWTFKATQHSSNYEDLDVLRAWLTLHKDVNERAFPFCGLFVERNTTAAITTAILAERPEGLPADYDGATAAPDRLAYTFPVNQFGITPAIAAQDQAPAVPAAAYIIGRGTTAYYSMVLGSKLTKHDMIEWAKDVFF